MKVREVLVREAAVAACKLTRAEFADLVERMIAAFEIETWDNVLSDEGAQHVEESVVRACK